MICIHSQGNLSLSLSTATIVQHSRWVTNCTRSWGVIIQEHALQYCVYVIIYLHPTSNREISTTLKCLCYLKLQWKFCLMVMVIICTRRVPVEGKSSVCLICINNYRIIILITGVLSLSAWVKYCYRILQIHHARAHTRTHAHACTHTYAHTCTHTAVTAVQAIALRSHPTNRDGPLRLRQCCRLAIQINTRTGDPIYPRFWKFFVYEKVLGRTETRTRDRMYCQTIRIVRDISRHDRARIATCRLRTLTDRQTERLKENYSIDGEVRGVSIKVT